MIRPGHLDLSRVATHELERLAGQLRQRVPPMQPTPAELSSWGLAHLRTLLTSDSPEVLLSVIEAVLAERAAVIRPQLELVWTGPEAKVAQSRDTAVVVQELFEKAQQHVLVAGYSFDHAERIFQPLHQTMSERAVEATFFIDLDAPPVGGEAAIRSAFLEKNWPFGSPVPRVFFDPRALLPRSYASLHAKCVVVDHRWALVTSANFTSRGQDRNIEVGVLIDDADFATALARQWLNAVGAGVFREAI